MKILIVTPRLLYPPDTGGKIRSSKTFEKLAADHELTIVCFRKPDETDEQVAKMRDCCHRIETIPWDESAKWTPKFFWELGINLLSRHNYTCAKYYSPAMERRIRELLLADDYDVLLCDFLHVCLNVLNIDFRPRILFQHNVEAVIRKRHYQQAENPAAKAYLFVEWFKLFQLEKWASHAFDHNIMVSERDCQTVVNEYGAHRVSALPTGVDVEFFAPGEPEAEGHHLVFTGSMDWLPNEDGLGWFCSEVMPRLREAVGKLTLWIVGRNPSAAVKRLAEDSADVEVTGTVDDVRPYIARAGVYVVPLRIGGGTRIKIFEAMAMEKAVVSTTIGAEGLPIHHGDDIILADDPQDFADQTAKLLTDKAARRRLGEAARKLVVENYTWDVVAKVFAEICENQVKRLPARAAG